MDNRLKSVTAFFVGIFSVLFLITIVISNVTSYSGYSFKYCGEYIFGNMFTKVAHAHSYVGDFSPDEIRISDIVDVQNTLNSYFQDNNSYPVILSDDVGESWNQLNLILSPVYIDSLPSDPCNERNRDYQYLYKSTLSGDRYILKSLLSDTGYRFVIKQHSEDVDGMQLNVWCGEGKADREYCLGNNE